MKWIRVGLGLLVLVLVSACALLAPTPKPPPPTIARILATPAPYATETPIPTRTPTLIPTPVPLSGAAAQFDGKRALEHNRFLAQEIGARVVGTNPNRRAGDYFSDQLSQLGYEIERQEFTYEQWENHNTLLEITEPTQRAFDGKPFYFSPAGEVEEELIAIPGFGARADYTKLDANNKIALVQRGTLSFTEKVANAERAGAVAILIYNNTQLGYDGALDAKSKIPAMALSGRDGKTLLDLMARDRVVMHLASDTGVASRPARNILARKRGTTDSVIVLGAHYDSIEVGRGAVSNASGVAVLLEIARVFAKQNLKSTLVFAAFDATEVGLKGSDYYVTHLPDSARKKIVALLNFDTVGGGASPLIAGGDGGAGKRARDAAHALGIASRNLGVGETVASDQLSFQSGGIDTVLFARTYEWNHSPQDGFDQVSEALLAEAGRVGARLIEALDSQ